MSFSKNVFTRARLGFLIIAVFCFFFVTGSLSVFGHRELAGAMMLFSATLIFPILLDMKTTRMVKGYWLVALGAFIVVWHTMVVFDADQSEVTKNAFQALVQVFALACAGAGGSIIAAHGDTTTTEGEITPAQLTFTSDSKRILDLQELAKNQTKWLRTFCVLVAILMVGLFFVLAR